MGISLSYHFYMDQLYSYDLGCGFPVTSGLGAFHFIISRALVVVYGVSLEDGLVYAILAHESQMIFGAILGIYSIYALVRKKEPHNSLKDSPPAPLEGG